MALNCIGCVTILKNSLENEKKKQVKELMYKYSKCWLIQKKVAF